MPFVLRSHQQSHRGDPCAQVALATWGHIGAGSLTHFVDMCGVALGTSEHMVPSPQAELRTHHRNLLLHVLKSPWRLANICSQVAVSS
eukprot:8171808-Pyramimonas_sp.AAC.1